MSKNLINRVREYLKDEELKIIKKGDNLDVFIVNKNVGFTILKGKGWEDVKKYIDKVLEHKVNKKTFCEICCEERKQMTGCANCANNWCLECMLKNMRKHQGQSVCPYCRHTVGMRINNPFMIDMLEKRFRTRMMMPCPVH